MSLALPRWAVRLGPHRSPARNGLDPDWDFFLPDDDEAFPEPGDFWIEPPDEE